MNQSRLPNLPWEEKPTGCTDVVWRYGQNPIIPRDLIHSSNSIFNSAVVPFQDGFVGVFRCDNKKREMNLHCGRSADGIHWEIDDAPIEWVSDDASIARFQYRYDPRVVWLEDRYYVTWCNGYHGPTSGSAIRMISKPSTSWKTPYCPTTVTVCFSPEKSTASTSCSAAPATGDIPLLGIYF